jgi:hypothetical protein
MCCIMRQCFSVGTLYGSWLGLTTLAQGWDVTVTLADSYVYALQDDLFFLWGYAFH